LKRDFVSFPITNFQDTKSRLLDWGNRFDVCCLLDNHQYHLPHHRFECLLAAGSLDSLAAPAGNAFRKLDLFSARHDDWLFGHFGFDLKIETEGTASSHPDHIQFPDLFFFVPEFVIELQQDRIRIGSRNADQEKILAEIFRLPGRVIYGSSGPIEAKHAFSQAEYKDTVEKIRRRILRGDCYEVNFCQEFLAQEVQADPLLLYRQLSQLSPTPFGAYYKTGDKFLLCASPERYLTRQGPLLLSQPIKGTWARDLSDPARDERLQMQLLNSPKDRSENVMVVDLVRNDLSKVCENGSVHVEELFGIYAFPQVHQMISSVAGIPLADKSWVDLVKATFPMGSMTGAPKKRVLELIETFEKSRRGLFSGAVGYVTPERDFDFNVVIRSILYNTSSRFLSFTVGSGITFYSEPEREYEECMIKASAIKKVLTG